MAKDDRIQKGILGDINPVPRDDRDNTNDNRDDAIKLLGPITKLERKYIPASWETYTKTQIWPRNGEVSVKGIQTILNLMAEDGVLKKPLPKVDEIIASSYLEEARKALGQ